jgi:hypothetical protein
MEFLHPFTLSYHLGTLADGLGSYPLDNGPYHPLSVCRDCTLGYSEFGWIW